MVQCQYAQRWPRMPPNQLRGARAPLTSAPTPTPARAAPQCVELKRDWAKGYSRLGAAYFGLEQWDEAIKSYEDGAATVPRRHGWQCGWAGGSRVRAAIAPRAGSRQLGSSNWAASSRALAAQGRTSCSLEGATVTMLASPPRCDLPPHPTSPVTPARAGLVVDPSNAALQSGLNDALSARNRAAQGGGGGLFGPDAMARLALDPRGRELLDDAPFMSKLKLLQSQPQLINSMLGDKKMQLVGERGAWAVTVAAPGAAAAAGGMPLAVACD